MVAFSCCTFER